MQDSLERGEESGLMPAELQEFVGLIESRLRCLFVAERPIDLTRLDEQNVIFVLQLPEGFSTAVGSRGGGFGERRLLKVFRYSCGQGDFNKVDVYESQEMTEKLDLPYHAAAFPIILPGGREKLVSGVADPEYVAAYQRALT
jgi:hypothetical protein